MSTEVDSSPATKPARKKTVTKKTTAARSTSSTTPRRAASTASRTGTTASKVVKKAPARKAATVAQHTEVATAVHRAITAEERRGMIATMAYYRSEQRGFEPGWDMDDWLESERIVDTMLAESGEK